MHLMNYMGIVKTLVDNGASTDWATKTKSKLKTGKRYLKNDYKVHIQRTDICGDHCIQYSLSDATNEHYKVQYDHISSMKCDRCENIRQTIEEIAKMIQSKDVRLTEEQLIRLQYEPKLAAEDIMSWKSHLLRTINQEAGQQSALKQIDNQTIFIIVDWAMKFLPRKFREHMADFFGKRGISWHVTAIISAGDKDAFAVQCLTDVLKAGMQLHLFSRMC